jgi:hypothetical protein
MPAIQTIKFRRGTATQWSSANPVLSAGEMGVETDTRKFKFGNGSSQWNSISYASAGGSAGGGFFVAETEPVGPNIGDIWYCTSDTGNIAGKSFIRYDGYWVELNPGTLGPAGANGTNGTNGAAATIAVGTVTTGAAGSSATVTNTGTSGAAVFAFSIPQGIQGIQGPTANIDEFVNLQVIGAY